MNTDIIENQEPKPLNAIGYYILVSGLWQKTTKEAYEVCSENGLPKARVNMEYWDESMEILRTTLNVNEAIMRVESYLEQSETDENVDS